MTEISFIKSLFVELDQKVEKMRDENALRQVQTECRIEDSEEKILKELRYLRQELGLENKEIKEDIEETKTALIKHEGYFTMIKVFVTTGVASLIAFYSWILSIINNRH